jgi:hypothetical protein
MCPRRHLPAARGPDSTSGRASPLAFQYSAAVEQLKIYKRALGSWIASDNRYDTREVRALRGKLRRCSGFDEAALRISASADANERQYIAEALADWYEKPQFVEQWVRKMPGCAPAHLVAGIHGIKWAWRARGVQMTPIDANECTTRAVAAAAHLRRAVELDARDPVGWAWLIACDGTLGMEKDASQAFDEAIRRAPSYRFAHSIMVQHLTISHGLDDDAGMEFGRAALQRAKPGSGVETIWCELAYFLTSWGASNKWERPDMQEKIRHAELRYFGAPGFKETPESLRNRNWFAFMFWKMGDKAKAAEHFRHIGKVKQVRPWGESHPIIDWLTNDFYKARKECMAGS